MNHQLIPLFLAVALIGLLGACKKADQTQSSGPPDTVAGQTGSAQTASANSKSGVLLQIKWPVGNRYVYRMDMDQHGTNHIPQLPKPMQQDVTMAMTYALSVLKETADAGRELEMEFLANEMEVKMGDQIVMSFDSKESSKNEAQNPMAAPFRKMIGSKVRLLVGADGKVEKVVGLDEWLSTVTGDGAGPAGQMLTQQFNEGFFRQLGDFGRSLSAKPVAVGDTWPLKVEFPTGPAGKIAVDAKITLKGWEDHEQHKCAILESRGTLKGTVGDAAGPMGKMSIDQGKITGRSWFDPELGAMIDYVSDQAIRIKGEMPGQPGGNQPAPGFTSELGQKITVKLVEFGKTSG